MTKERLEEIRKQKGTVYTVFDGDKEATALVLDEKCNENNILAQAYFCLNNLWETKERAEWHHKTHAERTERFEPPMWEDIEVVYMFEFITKGLRLRFAVDKYLDVMVVYKPFNGLEKDSPIFDEHATKENYIKACEIVRDLFNIGAKKN